MKACKICEKEKTRNKFFYRAQEPKPRLHLVCIECFNAHEIKACTNCQKIKSLKNFYKYGEKYLRQAICKDCYELPSMPGVEGDFAPGSHVYAINDYWAGRVIKTVSGDISAVALYLDRSLEYDEILIKSAYGRHKKKGTKTVLVLSSSFGKRTVVAVSEKSLQLVGLAPDVARDKL